MNIRNIILQFIYSIVFAQFIFTPIIVSGQKKIMTPEVYNIWKKIDNEIISNNGQYISYVLTREAGNPILKLYNAKNGSTVTIPRGNNPVFDKNSNHLIFKISPDFDSFRALKLKGLKKEKLPGDTLGIFNLDNDSIEKIADLGSFQVTEKWGHHLAILLENKDQKDKKEGSTLLLKNLMNEKIDSFPGVLEMVFAEEKAGLVISSAGKDSTIQSGLYFYDFKAGSFKEYWLNKGKFHEMAFSKDGSQLGIIADFDTTENEIRPYTLYHANFPDQPKEVVNGLNPALSEGLQISPYRKPFWSEDLNTMYFGLSPIPMLKDTSLLDDEKPQVEVWTTNDPVLYTMQEVRKKGDEKKSFLSALNEISSQSPQIVQLENELSDDVRLPLYTTNEKIIAISDNHYQKYLTWKGHDFDDLYLIDAGTGDRKLVAKEINGNIRLSPAGDYAFWFDRGTQHYYTLGLSTEEKIEVTQKISLPLGDELNDRPQAASNYGVVGWTENDQYLLVYDRYDIWKVDPKGTEDPVNLTNGRTKKHIYRYIQLDQEEDFIDLSQNVLLRVFDENNKYSGYGYLYPNQTIEEKFSEPYNYSRRVIKAKNSNNILFTKENIEVFPDLILSSTALNKQTRISNANPQQKDYLWGTGKLFNWKDTQNKEMTGMVFTPENFDSTKQYPLIINFYERSSDGLFRHRAPYAGRSTISYSYYLNQGYIIFNPDIPYEIGYPGKSALNAVMSGLDALIAEGYVDENHVGIQGHSWGGYQIAHILTKTNRFACAEAGAPVVNMTSAYGGIRWGSGMSRMFQYEKTQSRLGSTLWEKPDLYLENSPLFETDKVETPVLILHNDNDGAVPWYQGIEYYMALRRLGKTGWLLNYNGEPHWPLKWPNRLDFQTRMEQFFAHYLLDKPMPDWMKNGISELEKGKILGY